MDSAMQPYRLEVAVKRVYGLNPLIASTSAKIAVEVHFLDFPAIVVHPQGFAVGDTVTYNVCHKADFRMSAAQATAVFPAVCQCHLSAENDPSLSQTTQWSCPCALLSDRSGDPAAAQRTYANCVIRSTSGDAMGYAEMSCVVISLAPPPPPASPFTSPPAVTATAAAPAAAPSPASPPPPLPSASPDVPPSKPDGEQGKPYIVRVVVGESDRRRRGGRLDGRDSDGDAAATSLSHTVHGDHHRSSPPRRVSANTANKESLLYVLQYDVAYQLQSLSETTAAVLQREHSALSGTPLSAESKGNGVNAAKLTRSIDRSVAQMVKLANIVLQVANQLIDNSPAPPRTGTSREVKDLARQKRNPVNKLPAPADGSVGHYVQYDVLYQLQCLGTNLSYVTLAYHDVLDTPLSAIPSQHVEFCIRLGDEVQHLTKLLNILVQSCVDGALGTATLANAAAKATAETKKKSTSKHRNGATDGAKAKPSARALSSSEVKTSRSSDSSYSSFTRSSSSSSSSLSSSDSSLNRPMTPVTAPPVPAVVPVAVASSSPAAPSLPSQLLQPVPQVPPAAKTSPVPPPPVVANPPPPYAMVAASPPSSAAPPAAARTPPQDTSSTFLSVPGATPFSWVNAMNQGQGTASLSPPQPSLSTSITPHTSGVYGAAGVTFATPPVTAPTLSAPQLSVAPPRLSLPSPLTPPTQTSSLVLQAVPPPPPPSSAPPPPPPPLPAPAAFPIPVPVPR